MRPRELLKGFVFLLPIGRLTYTSTYFFSLPATPLGLGPLITQSPGNAEWEGTCRRHSDAQVNKGCSRLGC